MSLVCNVPHSNHLSGLFDCIIWVQVSRGGGGGDTVIFPSYIGLDLASTVYPPKSSGVSRPPPLKNWNFTTSPKNIPNSVPWPIETTLKPLLWLPLKISTKLHTPKNINFSEMKKPKILTKKIVHAFVCIKITEYPPPRPGLWYLLKLWIASQN